MYNPPPPSDPSEATLKWAAEAPFLMDLLRDFADMGTELGRRAFAKAIQEDDARQNPVSPEASPPKPTGQAEFERHATSVRRTIALIRHCAEPIEAAQTPLTPKPPTERAAKPANRAHGPLYEEIWDRPDRPDQPEWPAVFDFDHLVDDTAKWPCRKLNDKQLFLYVCREQGIYPPLGPDGKWLPMAAFDGFIKALIKSRAEAETKAAATAAAAPPTVPPDD